MTNKLNVFTASQATEILRDQLPEWYCEDGFIKRRYKTSDWKSGLMVVNAIAHLAEVAWHHPDLELNYKSVLVKLVTHSEKGITELDFELAKKIEELILWRPEYGGQNTEGR